MIGARNSSRRGAPLILLVLVLAGWIGVRSLLWVNPFPAQPPLGLIGDVVVSPVGDVSPTPPIIASNTDARDAALSWPARASLAQISQKSTKSLGHHMSKPRPAEFAELFSGDASAAAGHNILFMAAMAHLPLPRAAEQALSERGDAPSQITKAPGSTERWSLDAWAFWRAGSSAASANAGTRPIYGGSQAGAVLRYSLAPDSHYAPRVYLRGYRALAAGGETELASGVSVRPVAALPLRLHGELRALDRAGGQELRGSAFVTTELAPIAAPLGARVEAYAQAGYVSGEDATLFADAQLTVMREVSGFDLGTIHVGAGTWAGAQRDAHRIDIGPSLRLDLRLADTPARLSVDWRERVGGRAAPASGVAATLSTRF